MPAIAPPKARPIQYKAPLGTRWEKEKAGIPKGTFDLATDPNQIGPWILGECVGKGASGRVKVARHCETDQMAAVKILPLETVLSSRLSLRSRENKAEKHRNGIDKEIIMMKLMDHPNVVRIYDVFEGDKELFLVLEYVDGGELFDYLVNHGRMEPHKGLCYFKQIIYGLAYAHAFSVIHRDLKPENILIASLNPPHVKIADWGMAAFAPPEHNLETSCGSPHYASPEIVRGEPYSGTATDIWSCGVILYALMTGRLPFDDKNIRALLQKVKAGKFEIPTYVFPEAADLIRRMLVVEVDKRITMAEILVHPFLSHSTSNVTYVPAPSISELDRPLRSKAFVKQDLLSSLLLICADATYEEIVSELLSPPGQGSLIKALYFLLAKHRERTLEEYGMQKLVYNDGYNIKHYAAPPLKGRPAPGPSSASSAMSIDSDSTTSMALPVQLSQIRASRLAPAPPSPLSPGGPALESPSPSQRRSRPSSPLGPRIPRTSHIHISHKTRPASSPPLPRDRHADASEDDNDEGIRKASSNPASRRVIRGRTRPRTQTVDGLPLSRQRYDPLAATAMLSDALYPGSPRPVSGDVHTYSSGHGDTDAAPMLPPLDVGLAVPWLEKPTVEDPTLQRTIDDIARSFGMAMTRQSLNGVHAQAHTGLGFADLNQFSDLARPVSDSSKAVDEEHVGTSPKKLRLQNSNAQPADLEFRYSLPNRKTVNLISVPDVLLEEDEHDKENMLTSGNGNVNQRQSGSHVSANPSTASGSADCSETIGEVGAKEEERSADCIGPSAVEYDREDDSYMKIEKMDVECDAAMSAVVTDRRRRSSRAKQNKLPFDYASSSGSSQKQEPQTDGVSSSDANQSLLATPAVVGEVKGWFANLFNWKAQQYVLHSVDNCLATRDEAVRILQRIGCHLILEDAQSWGVLRCRLDEMFDTNTGAMTMKSVRFRVEFSPIVGYMSSAHGQNLGVTTSKRASAKHAAPFASTLVLHVHARLRKEWGGKDALRSPDPAGAATPMIGATPRLR
ncbi:kinase-like domain-containing protein [Phellopilus nigrolimitatus]|nr:kinase-like domain-containing protein [Phellopilus nigrolimitatus]